MLRFFIAAGALAASLLTASSGLATEPERLAPAGPKTSSTGPAPFVPNVRAALAVGLATMLIPGLVGGTRTALGADEGQKAAGLLVASGGFALAPIFSHMVTREWGRAAVFGALPAAATIAAGVLFAERPDAVYRGNTTTRTTFGIFFGLGLIGAIGGLVDTAMAGERARDRQRVNEHKLFVVPSAGKDGAMLTLGGLL